jgi:LDH2 family malate/lactate/ureidoglycolate dehydrogenase
MVFADLSGVSSHGVSRMTIYTQRMEAKVVSNKFKIEVEKEFPAVVRYNGCNSSGALVGKYIMERCIEKAKVNCSCFATVNHSNHFGMASYYTDMAVRAGMIGITATNAPPNIAPWGSSQKYFGTNPIAVGVPGPDGPIILDMAPSVVAMGKILVAGREEGARIPEGWALDKDGNPTTEPKAAMTGSLVPIGGPKGYGITLFIDVLCGILSGAESGPYLGHMYNDFKNPQNVGHFFHVIDISKFMDPDDFKKKIARMVNDVRTMKKNPGVSELFLPGEIEYRRREERKAKGVPVSEAIFKELEEVSKKYGVEFTV